MTPGRRRQIKLAKLMRYYYPNGITVSASRRWRITGVKFLRRASQLRSFYHARKR